MDPEASRALASWIPAPVLVGLVLALFGLVVTMAVMLLNRGFVSVASQSRTTTGIHKKINRYGERLAVLEDRAGIVRPRRKDDSEDDSE